MGRPPISTSAFGIDSVRSLRRVPRPPQRITTGSRVATATRTLATDCDNPRGSGPLAQAQDSPGRSALGGCAARRGARLHVLLGLHRGETALTAAPGRPGGDLRADREGCPGLDPALR